ncbi:MAG: DAK2 domain-containing protein, partial [Clostridiales bacterium]|nr:DAK2 domain-containing protein [Clostridiales bacterium]
PVPDGDTGTNMTLTIMSAAKEVGNIEMPTMESLAKAISSGSLRGARGNSGVILSQLFRGFTKVIQEHDVIDTMILANALQRATETAYKAVMKPKEGTILTVARGLADKASELALETEDLTFLIDEAIKHGNYVLSQTPEMLSVLKDAGVVDSGGQGLMEILKGAHDVFLGKKIDLSFESDYKPSGAVTVQKTDGYHIKFGYCTEFIIMLEKVYVEKTELDFKAYLESIGDSIVVVSDDGIVKVHVHTNDPGLAIQRALTYGSLTSMKIDNMREEHNEKLIKDAEKLAKEQKKAAEQKKIQPKKPVGFISVSVGEGLNQIFKGLGVDHLIEGGQTMNPSTEDILSAVDNVNADTVFILPNNSNIILAAEQATYLVEGRKIIVVPSKTIPQGITAIINYVHDKSPEDNLATMIEEMKRVKTGQVTYAVRDTKIDGKEIKENDVMGLGDQGLLAVGKEIEATALEMLEQMMDEDAELISIYYGADVSEEDAKEIEKKVVEAYPDCDIELHLGGQPIYYYFMSVE